MKQNYYYSCLKKTHQSTETLRILPKFTQQVSALKSKSSLGLWAPFHTLLWKQKSNNILNLPTQNSSFMFCLLFSLWFLFSRSSHVLSLLLFPGIYFCIFKYHVYTFSLLFNFRHYLLTLFCARWFHSLYPILLPLTLNTFTSHFPSPLGCGVNLTQINIQCEHCIIL